MSNIIHSDGYGLVKTKEDAKSEVRIWLRNMFESDSCVQEILKHTESKTDTKAFLLEALEGKSDDSVLSELIDELLHELDHQKASEPGLYLIDSKTGKSVIKLRKDAIYYPPDYVGEDGITRKSKPVLHPGISAPLVMMMHEESKISIVKENPKLSKATNAIFDPSSIIRDAEERLREMGYEVGPVSEGTDDSIEIGREYYDPLQSMNGNFHRHSAFGAILAKKIMSHVSGSRKYELTSIVMEKNSKQRWYRVSIRYA